MAAFATPTKVLDGALVGPFGNPKQRVWLGSNLFGKASENLIRVTHPSYPQQEHPPIQPSSGPIDSTCALDRSRFGSLAADRSLLARCAPPLTRSWRMSSPATTPTPTPFRCNERKMSRWDRWPTSFRPNTDSRTPEWGRRACSDARPPSAFARWSHES
jgi:hypothetical protein